MHLTRIMDTAYIDVAGAGGDRFSTPADRLQEDYLKDFYSLKLESKTCKS